MRPIRICFFVPPNDATATERAMRISSFHWGGHLNPIIPLFKRIPKHWREDENPVLTAAQITNGYLDAFDPDFLTFVDCDSATVDDKTRQTVEVDRLLPSGSDEGISTLGVGYFELANHLAREELRFERKEPLHLIAPSVADRYRLFLTSVVGVLPDQFADDSDEASQIRSQARPLRTVMGTELRFLY
jgi:hypothetical protein